MPGHWVTEEELEAQGRRAMARGIIAGCLASALLGFLLSCAIADRLARISAGNPQQDDLRRAAADLQRFAQIDQAITQAQNCLREWGLTSYADRLGNWQRRAHHAARRASDRMARLAVAAARGEGGPEQSAGGIPAAQGPAQAQLARQSSASSNDSPESAEFTTSAATPSQPARRRALASRQLQPSPRGQQQSEADASTLGPSSSSNRPCRRPGRGHR